jgi:hypothetical protein
MSKSFKNQITTAAKGSALNSLIPTGSALSLQRIRDKIKRKNEAGQLGRVGRPKRTDKNNEEAPSAEKGTKPGEMRKTYLVSIELDDKINAIAYWDRKTVKEVVNEALSNYVAVYEKKNGAVKPAKK